MIKTPMLLDQIAGVEADLVEAYSGLYMDIEKVLMLTWDVVSIMKSFDSMTNQEKALCAKHLAARVFEEAYIGIDVDDAYRGISFFVDKTFDSFDSEE